MSSNKSKSTSNARVLTYIEKSKDYYLQHDIHPPEDRLIDYIIYSHASPNELCMQMMFLESCFNQKPCCATPQLT